MPSGKTHAAITILAASGLAVGTMAMGQPQPITLALAGGCLTGVLITPDLDVDNPVRSHYVILDRWGVLAFGAWRLLWLPYSYAFAHRSFWSHAPVLSTLIRAGYLAAIGWAGLRLSGRSWPVFPDWSLYFLLGLTVSDVLHWAADVLYSSYKRKIRRKIPDNHF